MKTELETVVELVTQPEFLAGLRFGAIAFAAGLLIWGVAWAIRRRRAPAAVGGLLLAVAFALGLDALSLVMAVTLPQGLVLGLIALALAGLLADFVKIARWFAPLLAVPGAWLVVNRGDLVEIDWIRLSLGIAIVVWGFLLADFDRRWGEKALALPLIGLSSAGILLTVPDTEQALVMVGAALPIAILGWPLRLGRLGSAGAYAAAGVLMWTAGAGGYGRPSSIVGALACLGLFAIEPLTRALSFGRRSLLEVVKAGWSPVLALILHFGLVAVASRVAGLKPTVSQSRTIALIELIAATVLAFGLVLAFGRRPATKS